MVINSLPVGYKDIEEILNSKGFRVYLKLQGKAKYNIAERGSHLEQYIQKLIDEKNNKLNKTNI